MSGAPSTEVMTLPLHLLARGKIGPDRLRVVDGEYRADLREARQISLRHGKAALARALAVLVVRENLEAGRL